MSKEMWKPNQSEIEKTSMFQFMKEYNYPINYMDFHKESVTKPNAFWSNLINYFKINYTGSIEPVNSDYSFSSYGWLPNVKMNYAKNLIKNSTKNNIAITSIHESGSIKKISYGELEKLVSSLQDSLKDNFCEGDVLACYMPNIAETVISMLACSGLGGTFTSTSCDFGVEGVVDRFSQSKPKVLISVSGYVYNGKYISLIDRLEKIQKQIPEIEKVIIVDFSRVSKDAKKESITYIDKAVWWDDFLTCEKSCDPIYKYLPASHPLYIMYSSGTTGKPKCIVHSQGGTLLQHVKEHGLHCNVKENTKIMYFSTCGWMMWNWLVSALYFDANVYLYEGSPASPSLKDFFHYVESEQIEIFGTSPKFLKSLQETGYDKDFKLSSLKSILSTGAPLLPEQFDFVYNQIKADVILSSISGGTDILGCFMLGNPIMPVKRGEIQCLGLGMDVASIIDHKSSSEKNISYNEVLNSEGELVCKKSFPSRPLYFLNDQDNKRINDAYFNRYENIWHHGDFITITGEGGVIVHGRSDATLNPGGVRIGTAEIYRQTELLDFLEDSICVGKDIDGEVYVYLYVKMKDGLTLDDSYISIIKKQIRTNTTPRHVPSKILQVSGIPYTRSGKKMEIAVTRIIAGKELSNIEAVANPECLKDF